MAAVQTQTHRKKENQHKSSYIQTPTFWSLVSTLLYSTLLYSTLLSSTILYYTILYYTILYYTILYYTILYYTIPYHTIPYYAIPYYAIPYYTILGFWMISIINRTKSKLAPAQESGSHAFWLAELAKALNFPTARPFHHGLLRYPGIPPSIPPPSQNSRPKRRLSSGPFRLCFGMGVI